MRALTIGVPGAEPRLAKRPAPAHGHGETLLDVVAASLNPVDCRIAAGDFFMGHPPFPYVPGVEVVGKVRASDRFPADTHVWSSLGGLGTTRDGAVAEQVVVKDDNLVAIDAPVDPALAAALGTPGLAVWIPMTRRVPVHPSDTVVVLGATGAVGQVAIQVAKLRGARKIIGVGRSEQRLDRAMALGAHATVVLRDTEQMADDLRVACGPGGATYVFDLMWSKPLVAALEIAAPHARVVHVGQSAGPTATIASAPIRGKNIQVVGFTNFSVHQKMMQASYLELLGHAHAGRIELDLERVPLSESEQAWRRLKIGPGTNLVVCP